VNQWMSHLRFVALCFCTVLVAACGGGGDGGPPPPPTAPDMTGTWLGTLEDPNALMHTTSVTISGTSITEIRVNGLVTGRTGTVTMSPNAQVFVFTLNDGTKGAFFLDSNLTHAAFVDDEFNFGVVQKGASAVPTYADADINGSWSGIAGTTTDFNNFSIDSSTANCTHPTCTVTDSSGPNTVTFGSVDTTFGRWQSISSTTGALVAAFLSPDKQFAGTYACNGFAGFPGTCEFTAWKKQ